MSDRPSIVFSSWSGRYADNPRAIAEELERRGAPVEQVWLLGEQAGPVPDHVTTVAPEGPEAIAVLERTPYVISNDVLAHPFRKASTTTYLQTWHGTPLKRIAFDVARPAFPEAANYAVWLPRDIGRWDILLSPSRFGTEVLRQAFRFRGEVLETGYPRNDLLQAPERDAVRDRARAELGLADDTLAVLYAPTWRDPDPFRLELDLGQLQRELGDRCAILLRAHWIVADTVALPNAPNLLDVSRYQDLRELLLAADVLLTDYSSVMFDFAITGKPILFHVYDLPRYRDELRGFYFDFEAEAPGPLMVDTREVVAALRDIDAVIERYGEAYARFQQRFCHLEDGHASARVVDALFGADETVLPRGDIVAV